MVTVRFGPDGRVLVPVALRAKLGVVPGEPMVARVADGRLVIERRSDVLRQLQGRFASLTPAVSLVDELIRERRLEAEGDVSG